MDKKTGKENVIKQSGFKNTKAREAVLKALEKADAPVSADEIFIYIREAGTAVNLSTVYRTLELLERKGLAEKTLNNDGKARFELSSDLHRHRIICTNCHKSVPIDECPLRYLEKDVTSKTSFDITGHRLELYGLCPECKHNG